MTDETVALFLQDCAQFPRLPIEEEQRLLGLALEGDFEAGNTVIRSWLTDAVKLALALRPSSMTSIDAIMCGQAALGFLIGDPTVNSIDERLEAAVRDTLMRPPSL